MVAASEKGAVRRSGNLFFILTDPGIKCKKGAPLFRKQGSLMANEPNKIIYSMVGVGKFYEKKPVQK
jgi:hypothetical protein